MSVFEYSFFLLVGFIPIYNLVCTILNNNQQDFDKLNIKINMLIYSNEQLKTQIKNIMNKTKTVMEEENHLPSVVEEFEETPSVVEETSSIEVEESSPVVVEESSSIIIIPSDDDSDIDFVQDRVRNDKASQNLSYFISSKLSNISSNFF
jgi:hypothetical protein